MVRTAPADASSASAAADGVGDDRGGSGVSGVEKSGSAEAIAAVALVSVVANIKLRGRRKRAKHYQKGAPEKSLVFVPHPDCDAAVVKRDAVWEVGQRSRGKIILD